MLSEGTPLSRVDWSTKMRTKEKNSGEASQPHNVYLDQSAYGRMLEGASNWRESDVGAVLTRAQSAGEAQVWAGPTNVIETIQATRTDRRKALASMMLELIHVKRIWWGHEFEAVDDFFVFLTRFVPDAIRFRQYFEHHATVSQQTWLGVLALAASVDGPHFGPVAEDLRHTKAVNQLLHARFALAPDEWVTKMIAAAEGLETTDEDPLADLTSLSTQQITDEIDRLSRGALKLTKLATQRLDKKRDTIAKAYGGIEIGSILQAVFRLPLEIPLTFNIPEIVAHWSEVQEATGCAPLPREIQMTDPAELAGNASVAFIVVQHAIRAAGRKGLMSTTIGIQVIVREMQRCMNHEELPTGGLSFDADHAAALKRHDVLVTHDTWLASTLKAIAHKLETATGGKWRPQIVTTAKQLQEALTRPLPAT